jgi:hypothetical protein
MGSITQQNFAHLEVLSELADATQQLYLGMSPYQEWLSKKWKTVRGRKKGQTAKRQVSA